MRKWKDNENMPLPKFFKTMLIAFGIIGLTFLPLDLIFTKSFTIQDILNFCIGLFAIYAGKFNGIYKIMRKYAEWNIKRKDNKWR